MSTVVIEGGKVVDGSGNEPVPAAVVIENGLITDVSRRPTVARAHRRIDIDGQLVAPGFIDLHTHLDAQIFWDPGCTPVPFHGVTTVIGGNCGFSIAPLGDSADDRDYVVRMLARVEEIPIQTLRDGVPWSWRSLGEYLDAVEAAHPVMNFGVMAGHSAIRRAVMGERAVGEEATTLDLAAMVGQLRAALTDGALGFSSSLQANHRDWEGNPVPSRHAGDEEILELARVTGEFPGTTLEMIGITTPFGHSDRTRELMIEMSIGGCRKLNWNVLTPDERDRTENLLALSDRASERGADVYALTYPGLMAGVRDFSAMGLPGWDEFESLTPDERRAWVRDPVRRSQLRERAARYEGIGALDRFIDFAAMTVHQGSTTSTVALEGRTIKDIALEWQQDPWEVLCDVLAEDNFRTRFFRVLVGQGAGDWKARMAAWRDPRVILGGSDAGAHTNSLVAWNWATEFLARNREFEAMPIGRAVRRITGSHADLYGLARRGYVAPGYIADLTVFDPERIAPAPVEVVHDFPGGARRLTSTAFGISHVFVAGAEIVRDGMLTGARPGQVIRSGHDTTTVPLGRSRDALRTSVPNI